MNRITTRLILAVFLVAAAGLTGGCQDDDPGSSGGPSKSSPAAQGGKGGDTKQAGGGDDAQSAQPAERKDLVKRKGEPLTVVGTQPRVGDDAPPFTAVANDMSTFTFDPKAGNVWVISSVPSLDTPVCSAETKRFNDEAKKLGDDVKVLTVSMDLPFAQKRWCGAEGVSNVQTLSDSRDRAFGRNYGVQIKENGLLARAVYVVGRDGKVRYVQIVPEITQEPDYEPVLAAAREAAGGYPGARPAR